MLRGNRFVRLILLLGMTISVSHALAATPAERPKKVYAHYMGCAPAGTGPQDWARYHDAPTLRHDSRNDPSRFGGHVRNWDLVPENSHLTAEESADLEIRRAIRIGIDGFAIDAWAGSNDAKKSLDALFKVAEEKNYPFEITICIDPNCLGGESPEQVVRYLLDKHGKSPKLARRDGKPLIFGYQSVFLGIGFGMNSLGQKPEWKGKEKDIPNSTALRATPEGWALLGESMKDLEKKVGQPLYIHYCLSAFEYGVDRKNVSPDLLLKAAPVIAKSVGAIGSFNWTGPLQDQIGQAVIAAGAEWSCPVGMYQKENVPYECYMPEGTEWLSGCWESAIRTNSTILQLITWNDYGENTNIAPAYNTRYTVYDLTGYYIQLWKTGKAPVPDHDRVYVTYRKYPTGAKVFPFKTKFDVKNSTLEVVTILTAPATIRLPGRQVEYEAPAGFFRKQVSLTAGAVSAELLRDGKVALKIESPEPVTDKPFREDHGMVCFSSEFMRLWKEDFGDAMPLLYSEYGDADGDGLPNWFEMYWFGKFLNFSTMTGADPKATGPNGKTNLENYKAQVDPTMSLPVAGETPAHDPLNDLGPQKK
jgi:hypothetical protein